jgi:hypothetical protein
MKWLSHLSVAFVLSMGVAGCGAGGTHGSSTNEERSVGATDIADMKASGALDVHGESQECSDDGEGCNVCSGSANGGTVDAALSVDASGTATLRLSADPNGSGKAVLVDGLCCVFPSNSSACTSIQPEVTATIALVPSGAQTWNGAARVQALGISVVVTPPNAFVTLSVHKQAGTCAYGKVQTTLDESASGTLR